MIDLMKWLANGVTAHPPPPSFSGPQLRRNLLHIFHWGRNKKGGKQNNFVNCMSDDDGSLDKSKGKHRKAKLVRGEKEKKKKRKKQLSKRRGWRILWLKSSALDAVYSKALPRTRNLDSLDSSANPGHSA